MPMAMGRNSKKNAPMISGNQSVAARHPLRYQWCWCHGFDVGCGLVRSLRMHQHHALRERLRVITEKKNQAQLLGEFLGGQLKPTPTEKVTIRVYFKNLLGLEASSKLIVKYLPDKVEWWGKICIQGNMECVQSCWVHGSVGEMYRDASWARLELVVDEYKDNPGQPPWDLQIVCYSQVQSYIHITLLVKPHLKIMSHSMAIVMLVKLCKMNGKDASLEPVWYQDMETVHAFDVRTIDCAIGRIKVGD